MTLADVVSEYLLPCRLWARGYSPINVTSLEMVHNSDGTYSGLLHKTDDVSLRVILSPRSLTKEQVDTLLSGELLEIKVSWHEGHLDGLYKHETTRRFLQTLDGQYRGWERLTVTKVAR